MAKDKITEAIDKIVKQCVLLVLKGITAKFKGVKWTQAIYRVEFSENSRKSNIELKVGGESKWALPPIEIEALLCEIDNLRCQLSEARNKLEITIKPNKSYTSQFTYVALVRADNPVWGDSEEFNELLEKTTEARLASFSNLGEVDADVWMPLVDPAMLGGPEWPTRPAWQIIKAGSCSYVVSAGLANPAGQADGPNQGYGVEMCIASVESTATDLRSAWQFELAQTISNQAAEDGRFRLRAEKFGLFLFGVRAGTSLYEQFADDSGYCGFLIGLPIEGNSMEMALPRGNALLLTAKLLTRSEYEFAADSGPDGAKELASLFAKDGSTYFSSLTRKSVK